MRISEHTPGSVCWVDLGAPDMDEAARFYASVFGWQAHRAEEPDAGDYLMCHLNGAAVAGIGPLMSTAQTPMWTVYVATDSADATARAVEANEGRILTAPFDVAKTGRMGVFADPAGAVFGAWEPITFPGMQRIGEPGALTWAEVVVPDAGMQPLFYGKVFGWETRPTGTADAPYQEFLLRGRSVAGLMQMSAEWPAGTPAHWMPYFEVMDCDVTSDRCRSAGGDVVVPARDIEPGRFAMLRDPFGAHFSIIKMSEEFPR